MRTFIFLKSKILILALFFVTSAHGFEIKRVILSANDNPLYTSFWPIVAPVWEAMGFRPTLAFISDDENAYIDTTIGDVIRFKVAPGVAANMQAQVYRLFLPVLFPDDVCLIADIDLFPISRSYFVDWAESCPDDAFLIYRDKAVAPPEYPMCYVAAKGKVFGSVFNLTDASQFGDCMRGWKQVFDSWETDQLVLYRAVNEWESKGGHVVRLGHPTHSRLDRESWNPNYSTSEILRCVDCHCPRPYENYKTSIDYVISIVMSNLQK